MEYGAYIVTEVIYFGISTWSDLPAGALAEIIHYLTDPLCEPD